MSGELHINYGPATEEIVRMQHGLPRWCFHCRKTRVFNYVVIATIEPSYYEPNVDIRCAHCSTSDSDLFPGNHRAWEWIWE